MLPSVPTPHLPPARLLPLAQLAAISGGLKNGMPGVSEDVPNAGAADDCMATLTGSLDPGQPISGDQAGETGSMLNAADLMDDDRNVTNPGEDVGMAMAGAVGGVYRCGDDDGRRDDPCVVHSGRRFGCDQYDPRSDGDPEGEVHDRRREPGHRRARAYRREDRHNRGNPYAAEAGCGSRMLICAIDVAALVFSLPTAVAAADESCVSATPSHRSDPLPDVLTEDDFRIESLFRTAMDAVTAARRTCEPEAREALLDEAIAAFHAILVRRPDLVRVHLEIARAFFPEREDGPARRHFEQVLAGKPPAPVVADIRRILGGSIFNRAFTPVRLQPSRHHHPRAARHQRPGSRLQPDARRLELRQAVLTGRGGGLTPGASRRSSTGRPCPTREPRLPKGLESRS